jgi:hypothetical protein
VSMTASARVAGLRVRTPRLFLRARVVPRGSVKGHAHDVRALREVAGQVAAVTLKLRAREVIGVQRVDFTIAPSGACHLPAFLVGR